MGEPKHRRISAHLEQAIASGRLAPGQRLPSENELATRFRVSRPTAARAFRELQARGLVDRRAGSGSYVASRNDPTDRTFGLLIPGLGDTEIFEPICAAIARGLAAHRHRLQWGAARGDAGEGATIEALCAEYVAARVAGVFFAPVELQPDADAVNRRILRQLTDAEIPVVLLDRDAVAFPERSAHDLVSMDHRRASYVLTSHLLSAGFRQIDFLALPLSAPSVAARVGGYQAALLDAGMTPDRASIHFAEPEAPALHEALARGRDGRAGPARGPAGGPARGPARGPVNRRVVICANDVTAGRLMHALADQGVDVPADVAVVGFDDVRYATLLRVPLTTVRQPCAAVGRAAVSAMLDRLAEPTLPGRDILLPGTLVVRRSCGVRAKEMA